MTDALQEALNRMREAYRRGSTLVLLFDFDGTLAPIVDHPHMAKLDAETHRLLTRLAERDRVCVGILSGRELDELKSLVCLPELYLAGTGGFELELRGLRIVHPHADRTADLFRRLAEHLDAQVAANSGAWLENKKYALTVHYRHLAEHFVEPLRAVVEEAARLAADEVRIVQGPKAWEIVPANSWNKGTAVRLILADIGSEDDVLFYAGDGANDDEAIEEVAAMGGITLGIGPNAPAAAACKLPDHDAMISFLADLESSLEQPVPRS